MASEPYIRRTEPSNRKRSTDPVLTARANIGVAKRLGTAEQLAGARRDLNAAKLERAIQTALAAAPPLTDQQRARLAQLLSGGASA